MAASIATITVGGPLEPPSDPRGSTGASDTGLFATFTCPPEQLPTRCPRDCTGYRSTIRRRPPRLGGTPSPFWAAHPAFLPHPFSEPIWWEGESYIAVNGMVDLYPPSLLHIRVEYSGGDRFPSSLSEFHLPPSLSALLEALLPALSSLPEIPRPSPIQLSDGSTGYGYPLYGKGDSTIHLTADATPGGRLGFGVDVPGEAIADLASRAASRLSELPRPPLPSMPDPLPDRPDYALNLYGEGEAAINFTAGVSRSGHGATVGCEVTDEMIIKLWTKLRKEASFEASIQPSRSPAGGVENVEPTLSLSAQFGEREHPLPTFDWKGYPQMYLDIRAVDPYGAFIWDPILQQTLVWSSENWPSGGTSQPASPQGADEAAEVGEKDGTMVYYPGWDSPFPGEPGYTAWKWKYPEVAASIAKETTDTLPHTESTDGRWELRQFAAEQRRVRFPELYERGGLPRRRRRRFQPPQRELTEEGLRWEPYRRLEAAIRRSLPPQRRFSRYTVWRMGIREGRRAKRTFPGEPGFPAWKAAHPKEGFLISTRRPPRPPRRRYSPFYGRSRIEIDWKQMKVRFVHEAFWNRRPLKHWSRLQRASRLSRAVLRRRHRPAPSTLDGPPYIEPFLPVIGSLLLTVPPTVLYFLNDYKSTLPFAANYDPAGLRHSYEYLVNRIKLRTRLYYYFIGGRMLGEMMDNAMAGRAALWIWYKRTYLPSFLPDRAKERYTREDKEAEAALRAKRLWYRSRRISLSRIKGELPSDLYEEYYQRYTYISAEMEIDKIVTEECPIDDDWETLPWYFPLLQWWLPRWHWLNPPYTDLVTADSELPDYDYEYPAGPLPLFLDEKGRKIVEVTEEILIDAEDPEDTETVEEMARRDEAEKEKVLGKAP